jgi:hypothetical protein
MPGTANCRELDDGRCIICLSVPHEELTDRVCLQVPPYVLGIDLKGSELS